MMIVHLKVEKRGGFVFLVLVGFFQISGRHENMGCQCICKLSILLYSVILSL